MSKIKTVEDGRLTRASASLVNSFDETTPFGCPRRGWFKYVAGKTEPTTGNQELGKSLHKMNEEFLSGKEPEYGPAAHLFELGRGFLEPLRSVNGKIETPISTEIAGVPFDGFCDFSYSTDALGVIVDWKTTSSISKYGKTPDDLREDTQMLVYARALHPDASKVELLHGQYQTKGVPAFAVASTKIDKKHVDEKIENVIVPLVERIKGAVAEKDVTKLTRNPKACFNCPHKNYCPTDEAKNFMSIFSKYHATPSQAIPTPAPASQTVPAPAPTVPSPPPMAAPEPSRAHPQSPAHPEFQNAAPRKRGRPPGAGKKSVFPDMPVVVCTSPDIPTEPPAKIQFESVTFSYGATVNMGSFNSVRVDVSMTAKLYEGEIDDAYQTVMDRVKEKVDIEVRKLVDAPKVGEPK